MVYIKEILRKSVLFLLIGVFLVSAFLLLKGLLIEPYFMKKNVTELQEVYYNGDTDEEPASTGEENIFNFEDLKKINSDIKGWIKIPNTVIDYPVLQSDLENPEYYLKRDYKKDTSKYGSIFLDSKCILNESKNYILYGHSMKDGSMFSTLLKLNVSACKNTSVITFNTADTQAQWKIISILKTNTEESQGKVFNFLRTEFESDSDYLNYIYQLRIRSAVNMPVDFKASDRIITLSTCSYEFSGFRTVVIARQVRSDEQETVDTSKITANSKVLYPDCWYKKYKAKKPDWPETYNEAMDKGAIDWLIE